MITMILIIFVLLTFAYANTIQPVTITPVHPFSINKGYATDYRFSIYIPSAISTNASIEVEFPQYYHLPSKCQAFIKIGTNPFAIYACSKTSHSKYLICIDHIYPNEYTIVFEGVTNPDTLPISSSFKIKTYLNKNILVDSNEFLDSAYFLPNPGTSNNLTIKNIGPETVGLGSSYDFIFTLKQPLSKGDSIRFTFPEGYYFLEPLCFQKNSVTYLQTEVLHNNRSIICKAFQDSMMDDVIQVVSISGVFNPKYAGIFKDFYLETLEGTSAKVYERIEGSNYIQIHSGKMILKITSMSQFLSANTSHQFEFLFQNDVPEGGEVWIKFPPEFRLLNPNCRLSTSREAQSKKEVTCELAPNKTGYTIKGFTKINAGQAIIIGIVAENPSVAADYKIHVFSYSSSHSALIDEAYSYITIVNKDAPSKFLASDSIRWARRLQSNPPIPLKFIFSLNIPLPLTTSSTSYGKIIIDIKPQITLPPSKTLKCYFFNTVPAQNCVWDITSNSDRTTVIVWTPSTILYSSTQIPITLTTEDSSGAYGILLPTLIQRYKFYFYFWKTGDTKEHEVYFEDYVPDPIELAVSDINLVVAPLQYNQEAFMELVWTNTYYALGTNYFIEFEFDHSTPGWDYNLGFAALGYYDRYTLPCLVVNSLNPQTNYKCYLNPGGSAAVNSTIQILYIGAIPLNTVMTVRLPKIKLGLSGSAKVRFTLYENTPGENTLRIPIVYKDFSFTPSSATSLATNSAFSITLSTYKPDVDSTLTLSFTSTLQNPRYIIYEYPSLFTIATQTVPCSSNQCHIFTSNEVHWIVFAITNFQNYAASTSLTVHNPPYISTSTFFARTEKAGPIGDWTTNTVSITNGLILATSFATNSANPEINMNSLLLFDFTATTISNIPLDGSIVLTLIGLTVPDDDDFYCQIVSGLTGQTVAVGIICEKTSSTTIKIYNINAVPFGTLLSFTVSMWTSTSTSLYCQITTFYDRAASSTRLIDSSNNINLVVTYSNDNFASSLIINDHSGDIVRANGYGALTLSVTPTHTATQATITITFGTGFTLSTADDVLYCKLTSASRSKRIRCFATLNPLTISIPLVPSPYITNGSPVTIYLTTDYSTPNVKGIQAPSTPGYQYVTITITSTSGTAFTEKNGQYVYVYTAPIPQFTVAGTCTSADTYTIFTVQFTLTQGINSNTDPTTRGRILIEFPTGTGGFRADLGTGQPNGGIVGCRVLENNVLYPSIKCRLVKSPGNGLPAAVELVGFGAISGTPAVTVMIARVKNVQTTVGEIIFGLRVELVDVATGAITPREYTTYSLWYPVSTITTPTTYTNPNAVTFAIGSYSNVAGAIMYPYIYSNVPLTSTTSGPSTDYYIYELPSDFLLSSTVSCPASIGLPNCYSFPEIGWLVYPISGGNTISANTASPATLGTIMTVTMPGSFSSTGYTLLAYIWKNNVLDHYMTHSILNTYLQAATVAPLQSASITISPDQLVKGRPQTEITVSFTTYSLIPSTGTIEIRFQTGIVPQPHCKSAPSMGSQLTSSTGRVACTIQVNSWLITNFDDLPAGSNIRIFGFVNLPSTAATYSVQLYTYANQDAADIQNLGRPIDSLTSGLSITVQNYNSLSLDGSPSTLINDPIIAKASTYRPLIFDFTINSISLGLGDSIEITVLTSGSNFYNTMAPSGTRICTFMNINAGDYIACDVSATSSGSVLVFTLSPKQTLSAGTAYRGTITSAFAQNGADGLQHPSAPGTYQVSMLARQGSDVQTDIDFYEMVPDKFASLTVKNYVISASNEDVIDISLTTSSSIAATSRLVVELPTVFNGTTLFANDLGLGLIDFQDKICEIISSTPSGLTMSCFFQKGNNFAKTPAAIVLYGFNTAFTSLRFAFTTMNPSVTSPTVLPLTIYSLSGASSTPPFIKSYYQTVERAIIILPTATSMSTGTRPYYTPRTVQAITTPLVASSLTIELVHNTNLELTDYYAIKIPQMGSFSTVYSGTALTTVISGVSMNVLILPKNKWIILNPSSTILASGNIATITSSTFYNPEQGLFGSAGFAFKAYAAHFGTMTADRILYSSNALDFTGLPSFPLAPVVSPVTTDVQQNNVLTITINAVYQGINSAIIKVYSELTLREDCYEAYGNQIETSECRTDPGTGYIFVTLETKTFSSSPLNLILTILVINGNSATTVTGFDYYLYTTVETDPSNLLGQRYAVTGVAPGITLTLGANVPSPVFLEAEYVPYVENSVYYPVMTYGDLKFKMTLPTAVTSSHSFILRLPTSVMWFDLTVAGDLVSAPAVILYEPTDIPNGYVLVPAAYSSGMLSFPSVSISSGKTVTFTVTSMQKTGELVGIALGSSYSNTEAAIILEIYSSSTLTYTAQLGSLFLTQAQFTPVTLLTMTKAANEVTAWEFTINFNSSSTSMDNFYIDFPTIDDYGNPLWDYNLGVFTEDQSEVPCASTRTTGAPLAAPECIFFMGTAAQPARILVKSYYQQGVTMVLYLAGMRNPAAGRRVYMNVRIYQGTTFQSLSRVLGYLTEPSAITDQVDNTYYFVDGTTYQISGSYVFRTPLTIPSGGMILVKLDPACTLGMISGNQYFLSGTFGNYALMKLSSAVANYYSFNNFKCTKALGLTFTEYNMIASTSGTSNGERRTGNYAATLAARQGYSANYISLNMARYSTNMYNQPGVAKFNFNMMNVYSLYTLYTFNQIAAGFVITITFQNYYFASITSCLVYGGLALISPNNQIQCSASGLTITITNFASLVTNDYLKLQLSYTTVSSYSGTSPLAVFYIYGSSALVTASDFSYYTTVALPAVDTSSPAATMLTPGPPVFTVPPYPSKEAGDTQLSFGPLSIPSSFTSAATAVDYLRIGIEKSILSSLTTCSVLDNTPAYYATCTFSAGVGNFDYLMIRLAYSTLFTNLPATRISFSPSFWPIDPRDFFYEFAVMRNSVYYLKSNSVTASILDVSTIGTAVDILHGAINFPNEIKYSIFTPIALDTYKLLSFRYYNLDTQVDHLAQIDCVCTYATKCYNWNDGSTKAIDVFFTSTLPAGTTLDCYIPNVLLTGGVETPLSQIIDASSRAGYFSKVSAMSITPYGAPTTASHTAYTTIVAPPILPYTSYSVRMTVLSTLAYSAGSFSYTDFGASGIIYSCTMSTNCRSYSTIRNILVLSINSATTVSTLFDLFPTTVVTFSPRASELAANYTYFNYISYNKVVQSQFSTSVTPTDYSPQRTTITLTVDETRRGLLAVQRLSFPTNSATFPMLDSRNAGGMIEITVVGVTGVPSPPNCYAGYLGNVLTCSLSFSGSTTVITLTSATTTIPTSSTIYVYFRGNNPISVNPTITLRGFSYYDPSNPASNVKILADGAKALPTYTANIGTYVPIADMGGLSLITKTVNATKVPIRAKFKLTTALQAGLGKVTLNLPAGEYPYTTSGANVLGYFRVYATDFDFTQTEASAISVSGSSAAGLNFVVTTSINLPSNYLIELIIITDLVPLSNANFAQLSTDGKKLTATFDNSGVIFAKETINLYKYQIPFITIPAFYYTSNYANDPNILVLTLNTNRNITTFPTSMIEIELPSASTTIIKSGITTATRQLVCGITTLAPRTTSLAAAPRCILVQSTKPKIRIENYPAYSAGTTFNVIIYDLLNTVIPQDAVAYFDAVIVYKDVNTNSKSKVKLTRAFTANVGSAGATATSMGPTLSLVPYFNAVNVLTQGVTWSGTDCDPCRIVVRSSGSDWKFIDAANFNLEISGQSESILVDTVNNAFVDLSASSLYSGSSYNFNFFGPNFKNPLPYQTNSDTFTVQTIVNNHYHQTLTISLPYASLTPEDFTGTSSSCSVINNVFTGANGGNVACYLNIPIASSLVTNIAAIQIDFITASQYSVIYPYCEAYVFSGSTTVSAGQMTCSRIETTANSGSFLISGFSFSSGSVVRVFFRARMKTTSLTTNIYLQVLHNNNYYTIHRQMGFIVDVSGVTVTGGNAPAYFKVQPFSPTPLPINSPGTKSPLRIVTNIESAISASTGYIQISLGSGFPLNGLSVPQCSLRYESTYDLPIITRCSYDATNRIFKLIPVSTISTTGRYLITIASLQSDLATDGVTFPTNTNRVSATVTLYSGTTTIASDMIYLANIASSFYGISISPQYNLVESTSSQFDLNIQPSLTTPTPADTTASEVILVLEFPTPLYDYDLGASTVTYSADGIPYYNGIFFPSYGATAFGPNIIATLHYGLVGTPGRVIISNHTGFPAISQTISLSMVKNPPAYSPLQVKIQILQFQNGQPHATVLYQASYVNYYYTVPSGGETGDTPLWYFSNPYPQQATDIVLSGKYYPSVDTNSRLYVKLKNQAKGFNYAGMTAITCPGYIVQWYKAGYIFFLIPGASYGNSPTITCSGFLLGTTIQTVPIETGLHRNGPYIYASSQSITLSSLSSIPGLSSTVARSTSNIGNPASVDRYLITINTGTFVLKAGGYLLLSMPSGLRVVPGLSEYAYISGLTDSPTGSTPTAVQATLDSGNIKITGYPDFNGVLTFTVFLENINFGTQQIILNVYDQQGAFLAQSNLQAITVIYLGCSATGSVQSFLTDAINVFASENFRMTFRLGLKNTLSYSSSSSFIITLPSGFTLTPGYEICKYRLDTSTNWIRSPCTVSSQVITIPLVQGFDVTGGSVVHVRLTTENPLYTLTGMTRPSTTNVIYTFNIKTQNPVGGVESVFIPFVLYPNPISLAFTVIWYNRGAGDQSVIEVRFTTPVNLAANEFYQLDFATNDEIGAVFPVDLGTGSTEKRVLADCAEHPNYNSISNNILIGCYIQQGRYTSSYPARLFVRNELYIDTAYTNVIRFYAVKIANPGAIPGGFTISVMTPCRNDGYGCPRYRLRASRDFSSSSPKTASVAPSRAVPESALNQLLDGSSLTTFTFNLLNPVTPTDAIVVKTDTANIVIQNSCTTSGSNLCIHFPRVGWTFYQPSSTIASGNGKSIAFRIDNAQYYDRTNPYDLFIEPWSNALIQQEISSYHPDYAVKVPILATFPTQTDINNPYILRNFDNIIRISMSNIWKTQLVRRIIINTPSSYVPISTYCMAGINLADIGNTNYIEFPCQVTGTREITIIINDPSRWSSYYSTQPVYVYFRGFLPVSSSTGSTSTSTITSFTDTSLPYVLDENTGFSLTISSTPAAVDGEFCIQGALCNLCYIDEQCYSEFASYCNMATPRTCQACQSDSQCSHITGKPKCLTNIRCVECLSSSHCASGYNCVNYACAAPVLQIQLSTTSSSDTYLIQFPPQLVANVNVQQATTISLANIDPSTYQYSLTQVSATVFQVQFTVSKTIPITTLRVNYTLPSGTASFYTASIASKRIDYISASAQAASQAIQTLGDVTTKAMTVAAGSVLIIGNNPMLFWALINLIQTFYYLVFINVNYPANVQFFLQIFTLADFGFIPNPMDWFDPDIQDQNLPVPAKFAEYDVDGLFLNNVGNILLIWCLVFVAYLFSAFGNRYLNRPSKLARMIFASVVGWFEWGGLFRVLMTNFPDMVQAAFLQLRVLTFESGVYAMSSLFGIFFGIFGFVFPFVVLSLIKRLSQRNMREARRYSVLTEDYSSEGVYPKYSKFVLIVKWLLIMMIIVFLHDSPGVEIFFLTLLTLITIVLMIMFKPFKTKKENNLKIASETLFFHIHILIAVLIIDDHNQQFSDETRLNIGWAMMAFGAIIILIELGATVAEMVHMIKENWKLIKKVTSKEKKKKRVLPRKAQLFSEKSPNKLDVSIQMLENSSIIDSSFTEKSLITKTLAPELKSEISPEKGQSSLDISGTASEQISLNESSFTTEKSSVKTRISFQPKKFKGSKLQLDKEQKLKDLLDIIDEDISQIDNNAEEIKPRSEKSEKVSDRSIRMHKNKKASTPIGKSSPGKSAFVKTPPPEINTDMTPIKDLSPLDISSTTSQHISYNESGHAEKSIFGAKFLSKLFKKSEKAQSPLDASDVMFKNISPIDSSSDGKSLFMKGKLPKVKKLERSQTLQTSQAPQTSQTPQTSQNFTQDLSQEELEKKIRLGPS